MRIACLLTCFNRRAQTLACLEALHQQQLPVGTTVRVFLVDDGSTDGTGEAVAQAFPTVQVIRGNGELFWCGGMRLAWHTAAAEDYDGYLWLNDDTILFPDAVGVLIRAFEHSDSTGQAAVIVGATCDPTTGEPSYGGMKAERVMTPGTDLRSCETMNGNIVLVPRVVFSQIGNLSPAFRHTSADEDYALRARQAGFAALVAPGFLGHCRRNPCAPWCDPAVPLLKRWNYLHSPKGQPPREQIIYYSRHYRGRWPVALIKLYLRMIFPGAWQMLKTVLNRG